MGFVKTGLFIVVILSPICVSVEQPFVSWTMDNHTNVKLFPKYNTDPRWIGNLTTLSENATSSNLFFPGVHGNAIRIQYRQLRIATNLSLTDCIANPGYCETGMSLTFWINLYSWENGSDQSILCAASDTAGNPFRFVRFSIINDTLVFCVALGLSKEIHCISSMFNVERIQNRWTHVGLTWNTTSNSSNIAVDGIFIPTKLWSYFRLGKQQKEDAVSCRGKFEIGNTGDLSFYLDDLKVFYNVLDGEDMKTLASWSSHSGTSVVTDDQTEKRVQVILIATMIPLAVVGILLGICCYFFRKRRTNNSFQSYVRQTSRKSESRRSQDVYSDMGDDHTDLDSEAELEKLHNRLINRV